MKLSVNMATERDLNLVPELADLINRVYDQDEAGIWVDGYKRTNEKELTEKIRAGHMVIARNEHGIAGCIETRISNNEGYFGMLVCNPKLRGQGIGTRLIDFAEEHARKNGARTMRLDILEPTTWAHDMKEFLKSWYVRLGYRQISILSFGDIHPESDGILKTDCRVLVFRKTL